MKSFSKVLFFVVAFLMLSGLAAAQQETAVAVHEGFKPFAFMNDPVFTMMEKVALWSVLGVAILGLLYAGFLMAQVLSYDKGTPKMQEISTAIRVGANAYLNRQFKAIVLLMFVLTAGLYFTAGAAHIQIGRACAFLMGAFFSAMVGFVGMNLAVQGNVRVAAASRTSFGQALKIAYRTGTITGMLTDGLGLLGGTVIFMIYGEQAYEVLLGFGFGGTLLALFMRVGGGIYTKAADVGADLVGKIEKNIPEDDPRNAATIADNVGDNVGDCAGMAADIFESYEVTIVSAMIL
ncbi:MAG TPA: sodium/proton-translocating pyrophosphatase, partial [Spirochaetales bacterium]|nr:sodium/proton-translocating pyrophosphatase [Spirochaetales bacterium]